ncbi:MAG: lysophospholipid acyltransferase family protein [Planctomycetes bacterium]|nr:lysophospholipid acyltransferase family protein [Planctomycetota bacterium]MBT4029359.1 lysophospholipid acyltransferase family protein [Planctomycetota bacterium]MBT4559803.1 lysophospholipid acyltransferase family protein [Planctomycetota bacterium]MBT5101523.1 lysophospholipid acyltransferase family protein [Planctomycetota bacterium]MBT5120599.1 lysophospholipid acyltransferase family protein [Planctomycetota bacterium]
MTQATKPPPTFRKRFRRWLIQLLAEWVGTTALRLLATTWRVQIVGQANRDAAQTKAGLPIWIVWHEHVPTSLLLHRGQPVRALISHHHDGEVIARITKKLGLETVRGSSSKGGREALREMVEMKRSPYGYALTPDGPRGPRHSFAPGALKLAVAIDRPLLPNGYGANRAWRMGSWDRMMIPKPFSKVVLVYGPPIFVSANDLATATSFEATRERCIQALRAVELEADNECR